METILIAESAPAPQDLLVYGLKDDYTVLTAMDGTAAVELATRTEPDLVFMALDLPCLDGASAIRQLKAQPRLHDIPIIDNRSRKRGDDVRLCCRV